MPGQRWLLPAMLAGIILGALGGWFLPQQMIELAWLGQFFLDALKMLIVPLIITSMVTGIAQLGDIRKVGRTGVTVVVYYFITTGMAVLLGIILVNIIRPGLGATWAGGEVPDVVRGKEAMGLVEIIRSFISPNIMQAMTRMDILPLIVFSLIFGAVLTTVEFSKRDVVLSFFDGANQAIMKMVHLIMWLAPIGVLALVGSRLGEAGGGSGFLQELLRLGRYSLTVMLGLAIHGVVVLPLILFLLARRNPWRYFLGMGQALSTAFSTASSSATLPVTLDCAEENNKVSRRSALFVLPIGATINMDGTALYESVAAIFIAQATGHALGIGQQALIFITATLAAVGAAGIPQAGLVTMVIVLRAVGLPLEGIGMILAIDWFLDRCRTTVNVWGDAVGAAVIDRLEPPTGEIAAPHTERH
ncbi:MAG: cation:dicarboxylase symporter family transporter [Candidatus Eisenbacteria bacterium]|nr:cation:dicarboxylase symporter family transporter [Candidatus Eisenbacteria bacterium]